MFFFFKQKTAYEMRISDWSSDVCSSDLGQQAKYRIDARAHGGDMNTKRIDQFVRDGQPKQISKGEAGSLACLVGQIRNGLSPMTHALGRQIGRASCRE